jgi:hypothetical protein
MAAIHAATVNMPATSDFELRVGGNFGDLENGSPDRTPGDWWEPEVPQNEQTLPSGESRLQFGQSMN